MRAGLFVLLLIAPVAPVATADSTGDHRHKAESATTTRLAPGDRGPAARVTRNANGTVTRRLGSTPESAGADAAPGALADPSADPQLERGWPAYAFSGSGSAQGGPSLNALVGEIDGDPGLEVLAQGLAAGPLYAFDDDGTPVEGWPDRSAPAVGYPTLGDLTPGSGRAFDVVIRYWPWPAGRITARRGDGSVLPGWWPRPLAVSNQGPRPAVVTDVNGDGVDEVVTNLLNETYILDRYGNEVRWGSPITGLDPAVVDLDGDGRKEFITYDGSSSPYVVVYVSRLDGSSFPGFPLVLPDQYSPADRLVSVGDVTGDGRLDLVLVTKAINHGPAMVHVIDPRTLSRRVMAAFSGTAYGSEPALADLDGDGVRDIVVQTEKGLDAWRGDGTRLPGFPVAIGDPYYAQKEDGDPVVGDVDGDQRPDIVLVAGSGAYLNSGLLYAFNAQGRILAGFPKAADGGLSGMPAIADIDRDGRNEIIGVGQRLDNVGQKPAVWVWDLGGGPHGAVQWGQHKGGPRHEGIAGASTSPPQPPGAQGTAATGSVTLAADVAPGATGSAPRDVVAFRGGVAFSAWRPDVGRELFVSDGTPAGTRLVADIAAGSAGSGVRELAVVGDTLFFVADDGLAGAELWRSDGTAGGTRRVADLRPGSLGARPEWLTPFGSQVYFSADDGTRGRELWRSDGSAAGTTLVADLKPGPLGGEPKDLTVYAGSLYFLGYNQYLGVDGYIHAEQFLQWLDTNGKPAFAQDSWLNSGAYGQPDYGHVDWAPPLVTDGQFLLSVGSAGARRVCIADQNVSVGNTFQVEVAPIGGVNVGAGNTLLANCETPIPDTPFGAPNLAPRGLTDLGGTTWFAGTSAAGGRELWSTDGTAAGTAQRMDLLAGSAGSNPTELAADRMRLLLSAQADARGREPWQALPGGMAGAVADVWPGPGGSSPRGWVRSGTRWFFVADDPDHGGELWTAPIETVAPTVTASVPALVRSTLTATIVAGDDTTPASSLALRCRVDARAWANCGTTYTATGLTTGTHTLTVQALDQSGNVGAWTGTFRSDSTAPAVPSFSAPTATAYLSSPVAFSYRSTDVGSTVASYDLRYRTATPTTGFTAYTIPSGWSGRAATSISVTVSPGLEVCVSARARDAAGNTSAWSADRCTGMPLDDRSLAASSGWSRVTSTAYFRSTATATRTTGATLSRTGVTARRIAVVATVCPTCGSVSVYLGGTYLGSIGLTSSTTTYRRVLSLPLLSSARSGTLQLRSRSSAYVAIDGVLLRRT